MSNAFITKLSGYGVAVGTSDAGSVGWPFHRWAQ